MQRGVRAPRAPRVPGAPSGGLAGRLLSCLRYREILVLQGAPLLGAATAVGTPTVGRLAAIAVLAAANFLLVAHVFALNDWAGADADLNDTNRLGGVFAAKGIRRRQVLRLWIGLLALSLALFATLGARPLAIAAAIALCSFLYSHSSSPAKGIPVLGSLLHLVGGMLHFLLGVSLFRAAGGADLALALFFGLVFMAGHLNQEVRDAEVDAGNGIRTNAVAFGKKAAFLAGLAVFTAAYALLAGLAAAGVVAVWLGGLGLLLVPLQLYWSSRALAAGLGFAAIRRLQARYRVLFAVLGGAMLASLLLSAGSLSARRGASAPRAWRYAPSGSPARRSDSAAAPWQSPRPRSRRASPATLPGAGDRTPRRASY